MTGTPPKGTLVAVGGNEDKTANLDVLGTICSLMPGGAKIVEIIPIASRVPEEAASQYFAPFKKLGVEKVGVIEISTRTDANNPDFIKRILAADVVFFTGGDQLRITNMLGGSKLLETILGHYDRGGVVAGTSAGAAAMSANMIYQGRAGQAMRKGTVQMTPGMGLLRGAVLDSHFSQRGRFNRLLEVVTAHPGVIGLGLDEDSGVIVRNGTELEAIGSGVVVVVDGHEMRYANVSQIRMGTAIAEEGVMVHTLTSGHGYDLATRKYIRAPKFLDEDHEDSTLDSSSEE